ncbi:hypothetical protein [Catalinimonas niigatensis]|uniref:hypothetical protein n=1 Tax=Catalinimonas niigatensis TaxID=1397264 RepID=UPI002666E45F|nr:hypothetical protein [Catalinimonas niigatensis]WPP51404.1 hypothetical protein PZB72_03260 [Catalinimonas niigatensis]
MLYKPPQSSFQTFARSYMVRSNIIVKLKKITHGWAKVHRKHYRRLMYGTACTKELSLMTPDLTECPQDSSNGTQGLGKCEILVLLNRILVRV